MPKQIVFDGGGVVENRVLTQQDLAGVGVETDRDWDFRSGEPQEVPDNLFDYLTSNERGFSEFTGSNLTEDQDKPSGGGSVGTGGGADTPGATPGTGGTATP